MASPESSQYYPDIQEKFYAASLEIPTIENTSILDAYATDGTLHPSYEKLIRDTITALQVVPDGEEFAVALTPRPHENSSGQYHFEKKFGPYETYAYYLPPGQTTSHHAHEAIEFYFLVGGVYTLRLNEEEVPLMVPDSRFVIVGPGVEHQGKAGNEGALVVTVTHNPNNIPKGDLHMYHDSWKKEWEKEKETVIFEYDNLKV